MHWGILAFLIWASALAPLSRRFICDFIGTTLQHVYSLRAAVVLVTVAFLISYRGHEISPTYVLQPDTGWLPVTEMMREVHEGASSLIEGRPLNYWGVGPFCDDRSDWEIRYASVFQIDELTPNGIGDT
jgi:hypothetical protein